MSFFLSNKILSSHFWTRNKVGYAQLTSTWSKLSWDTRSLQGQDAEGNGTPLHYSCLENPTDGGAWWAAVYGVTQSRTRLKRLSSSSSSSKHRNEMIKIDGRGWRDPGSIGSWRNSNRRGRTKRRNTAKVLTDQRGCQQGIRRKERRDI